MLIILGSVYATTYHSTEEKDARFMKFVHSFEKDEFYNSFLKKSFKNGETFFHISYHTNHNGASVDKIVDFFKEELPQMLGFSAFGNLYIYDDEGTRMKNEFELYVLRKGVVVKEKDTLYSPFSSKVSPDGFSHL